MDIVHYTLNMISRHLRSTALQKDLRDTTNTVSLEWNLLQFRHRFCSYVGFGRIFSTSLVLSPQTQTVTKKVEKIVEEAVNATAVDGLVANITKEPQFTITKTLQLKNGMNVLGMSHIYVYSSGF